MDDIELVLRRQQGLWAALLGGGTEEERTRERQWTGETERWAAGEWLQPAGVERSDRFADAAAGIRRTGFHQTEPFEAGTREEQLAARLEQRGRWAREAAEADALAAMGRSGEGTATRAGERVASRAHRETESRLPEGETRGGGPEDNGSRALSLALERDARRYDGGFSLY